jgi:hypothetical protein
MKECDIIGGAQGEAPQKDGMTPRQHAVQSDPRSSNMVVADHGRMQRTIFGRKEMAAKEVKARDRMLHGIDILISTFSFSLGIFETILQALRDIDDGGSAAINCS